MRLIVLWVGLLGVAHAQTLAEPLSRWELGAAALAVSQQAYPGSDQQVQRGLLLPYFIYRGQWLRADNDSFGLRAVRTENFELDVGVAGAFGSNSNDIDARRGMPNLGTLVEFGPRAKWKLGAAPANGRWTLALPLRAVFDLSDSLAHRGWSFEPELAYRFRASNDWRYTVAVSAIVADRKLADTFYGVAPGFATAGRSAYVAQPGLVAWRLSSSFTKPLGRDWLLLGFARVDNVAGSANRDSPLVRQNNGWSTGIGLSYTWLRSSTTGSD